MGRTAMANPCTQGWQSSQAAPRRGGEGSRDLPPLLMHCVVSQRHAPLALPNHPTGPPHMRCPMGSLYLSPLASQVVLPSIFSPLWMTTWLLLISYTSSLCLPWTISCLRGLQISAVWQKACWSSPHASQAAPHFSRALFLPTRLSPSVASPHVGFA